jgi:hypothetical protein
MIGPHVGQAFRLPQYVGKRKARPTVYVNYGSKTTKMPILTKKCAPEPSPIGKIPPASAAKSREFGQTAARK